MMFTGERPTEALGSLEFDNTHIHTYHSQSLPKSETRISHDSLSVLFKEKQGKAVVTNFS